MPIRAVNMAECSPLPINRVVKPILQSLQSGNLFPIQQIQKKRLGIGVLVLVAQVCTGCASKPWCPGYPSREATPAPSSISISNGEAVHFKLFHGFHFISLSFHRAARYTAPWYNTQITVS